METAVQATSAKIESSKQRLGLTQFVVKINNRKLLTGMGQYSGVSDAQLPDLYRSIDKFDKIGAEGVEKELIEHGLAADAVSRMMALIQAKAEGTQTLDNVEDVLGTNSIAKEALDELRQMAEHLDKLGVPSQFYEFDFTTVRGLGYYTGPIFEAVFTGGGIGSIAGGGRYDDLIGLFRKQSLPTSGVSLGIERIIVLLDEMNLYPDTLSGTVVQAYVTVFGEETRGESMRLAALLRQAGIRTELSLEGGKPKLGKQFAHADGKGIPLVVIVGPDEMVQGLVKLKRLRDGFEITVARESLAEKARELLSE
ncbi:histidine--tRNA ligase family protein [bacterium]|nr:histidine--tRNA ligase family protein [bacterium]